MHEDRLRAILPFLRPRTEEPTGLMLLLVAILCLGIASLVALHIWRRRIQHLRMQARFAKLATEKNLDPAQATYLAQLARQSRMNNPLLLLNSIYAFDRIVGRRAAALTGAAHESELHRIGAVRSALEFDHMPPDQPLRTTRQLESGLTVMVWHEDTERYFPWLLVARDERGLTIAPLFREDYEHFTELSHGDLLAARFWREQDTEYRFCGEVLTLDRDSFVATLRHDEAIERLQHRDFYRLDIQFAIDFAVVDMEGGAEEDGEGSAELLGQTLKGQVLNLSAGGLSALVDRPVPGGKKLRVDPSCNQPFALGGLVGEVLGDPIPTDDIQVQFAALPPERERVLVRQIYQYQLGRLPTND